MDMCWPSAYLPNLSTTSRMRHKVNYFSGVQWFEFPFPRLFAEPRLKNFAITIYIEPWKNRRILPFPKDVSAERNANIIQDRCVHFH